MLNTLVFDSQILPNGHLSCPKEFANKKNVQFKVLVIFDEHQSTATDQNLELAAIQDLSNDTLSQEELEYYMGLDNS